MPNPYVNSRVQKVEVENANGTPQTVVVTVGLTGFAKGESVQLSGYAVQWDGGFAPISGHYGIDDVDTQGAASLLVTVAPSKDFVAGKDVMTAVWASKVWMTDLKEDGASWVWKPVDWAPKDDGNGAQNAAGQGAL
jgi:hypothetical protein